VRGYLGVRLPAKIDGGVTEQLGIDSGRGALLAGIQRSSPADVAKLQPVDFITELDGHKIDGISALRLIVAQIPVGKQVVVNFIRGGVPHSTTVKIAESPKNPEPDFSEEAVPDLGTDPVSATSGPPPAKGNSVLSGLTVTDLNDKTRQKFGIDDTITSGVVITNVQEGSPADSRGVIAGDVIDIASAERGSIQSLASPADFANLTKKLKPEQSVVLLVHHGKTSGQEDRSSMFVYLEAQPK